MYKTGKVIKPWLKELVQLEGFAGMNVIQLLDAANKLFVNCNQEAQKS